MEPSSLLVPLDESTTSIAKLRQFSTDATALLTDLNLNQGERESHDGGEQFFRFIDCTTTFDFVSEDFVRRFSIPTVKSKTPSSTRQRSACNLLYDLRCSIRAG
jgi:hypothetical protein